MAFAEVDFPAEPEINRHEHQACAMSDGHGKGPKPQLRRWYSHQCPWMAPVNKPEDTEPDDKKAGADLDLALPFDEGDQQREGEQHQQHREQMAGR